jgi:hypothetical protein
MDLALPPRPHAAKRSRGNQREAGEISLEEVTRLALATSAGLKALKAGIVRIFLVLNEHPYAVATKLAGKQYNERRQKADTGLPQAFIVVGHALLKTMAEDVEIPPDDRKLAIAAMSHVKEYADLYSVFRICNAVRCHDGLRTRIEFAMSADCVQLANALSRTLCLKGKAECFGSAPKLPLDRSLSAALARGSSSNA